MSGVHVHKCIEFVYWYHGCCREQKHKEAYHLVAASLDCEMTMVGTGGSPLTLTAWTGLENTILTL